MRKRLGNLFQNARQLRLEAIWAHRRGAAMVFLPNRFERVYEPLNENVICRLFYFGNVGGCLPGLGAEEGKRNDGHDKATARSMPLQPRAGQHSA